ncbi:MAG: hypothetical protein A4E64_00817 [Syntrophorhabdus sp. PtaU1.Bin058]|nr:MAG: hypothetical protein A4E64_00817 [Syntrophorhabdus sp. PtaU1.Bin058]
MYKIEKKDYGFFITFSGFVKADEMKQWVAESGKALAGQPKGFGIFADLRELKPLPSDAQQLMEEGQKLYKQKGMVRSVVALNSATMTMQFQRIAKETGIYEWERYVDASRIQNWQQVGVDWIKNGIDPDKN